MVTKRALFKSTVLAILFGGLLTAVIASPDASTTASAHGGRNDECNNAIDVNPVTGDLATYTAPVGETVTGVCIKAGNDMFGDGHSDSLGNGTYNGTNGQPCYIVTGVGTPTVTVTRIASGNECKELSHIDIYKTNSQVTPTSTDTPTPTPTCTPTPTTKEECEQCNETDPSVTPTPTPTTGQADPTATPTPGSSNSTSTSTQPQVAGVAETKPTQAILAASTMAPTGSFMPNLINGLMSMGVLFLSIGSTLYGKTNTPKTKKS